MAPYFLAPKGQEWSYRGGNDSWGLEVQGLEGTDGMARLDQVNVHLYMTGHPVHGVYLLYDKWDGRVKRRSVYNSKGDLNRLREVVRSLHGSPLPVGLFIPFEVAWKGVKEFIESNGKLPKSIEWIANCNLPAGTFPEP